MSLSDRFDKVSAIKEDHILTAIDEMKEMGHNHQSEQGALFRHVASLFVDSHDPLGV